MLVLGLTSARASTATAQRQQRIPVYGELRAEGIFGEHEITALAGGGIVVPAGTYTRLTVSASAGAARTSVTTQPAGRVDVVARFLLDPLREMPWGLSLGGGLTVPYARTTQGVHPLMTALIDVEGRRGARFTPAVQVGLGGGVRVALVWRASSRPWR
jgi:hypothetical protein